MTDATDDLTRALEEVAMLRERVRWLEGACIPALKAIGELASELAGLIEGLPDEP